MLTFEAYLLKMDKEAYEMIRPEKIAIPADPLEMLQAVEDFENKYVGVASLTDLYHIHYWFVKKVKDGEDENAKLYVISKEIIQELYNSCKKALADKKAAYKWIPTRVRFSEPWNIEIVFDEREYFRQILSARRGFKELLQGFDFENDVLLYTSYLLPLLKK